jgi:hypothetical protein
MPSSSDDSVSRFARLMALAAREGFATEDDLRDPFCKDLDHRDLVALGRTTPEWPRERVLLQLGLDAPATTPLGAAARAWLAARPPGWALMQRRSPRPREQGIGGRTVTRFPTPARGALELPSGGVVSWGGTTVVLSGAAAEVGRWMHDDEVVGAAAMRDGGVVSFAYDGSLARWSPNGGLLDRVAISDGDPIVDVLDWSGQGMVAVSSAGTMYLWRPGDLEAARFSSECDGDAAWRRTGAVIVDDQLVSFVSSDLIVRRYHDDPEPDRLAAHADTVVGVIALGAGRVLTWSDDRTLRIWQVRERRVVAVLAGHTGAVTGAARGDDGTIVSWGSDRTARRWRADGTLDATFEHPARVARAAWLPGGGVATLADDGVRAWVATEEVHFWPVARPIDLQVIGDQLAVIAVEDPAIHVMVPSSGASSTVVAHGGPVLGIEATGVGLLSWSQDGLVLRWAGAVAIEAVRSAPLGAVRDLVLVAGRAVTVHATGRIATTDLASGQVSWSADEPGVDGVAVLDEGRVVSWSAGAVNVRRIADGELAAQRTEEPCGPTVVSRDGLAVTRSRRASTRTAAIWRPGAAAVVASLAVADGWSGACWLPGGDALLWSDEGRVFRWQRDSSELHGVDTAGFAVVDIVALAGWTAGVTDEGALLRVDDAVAVMVLPVSAAIEGAIASPRGELVAWSATGSFQLLAATAPDLQATQQGRGHRPAWVAGAADGVVAIESDGAARYVSTRQSILIPDVPVQTHSVAVTPDGSALVVVRGDSLDLHRASDGRHAGRWQSDVALRVHAVTIDRQAIVATSRGEVVAVRLPPIR